MIDRLHLAAGICWASPWSLLGLVLGALGLLGGGQMQRTGRVIEFHGPALAWLLRRVPIQGGASAMTLGHVVIAADIAQLIRTRRHERVHVRQYERWGVLFVPAYLAFSLGLLIRGRDPYRDNPFEREAFEQVDGGTRDVMVNTKYFRLLLVLLCMILFALVAHAQRAPTPEESRRLLVEEDIISAGVKNPRVLDAIRNTPRHELVPIKQRKNAYYDMSLPIGDQQTISSPFIVAYMTESLDPQPTDRVLEIGTGSGYQAAVLSLLVKEVYTIEIVETLGLRAQRTLSRLGYENVHVRVGDGFQGWSEHAPYDKIIVTCSPEHVPQPLMDQLAEGGKMVIPVGQRYQQVLFMYVKNDGKLERQPLRPTLFVPMTGQAERQRATQPDPSNPSIANGSFEDRAVGEHEFNGWFYQRQLTRYQGAGIPDGNSCALFQNETPDRASHCLQGFAVDGRSVEQIRISAKVKVDRVKRGSKKEMTAAIVVSFYDAQRSPLTVQWLGPWTGSSHWRRVAKTVSVPHQAREAILRVGLFGATGKLYVDDVQVSSAGRPGP